jgi:hypothetical protein
VSTYLEIMTALAFPGADTGEAFRRRTWSDGRHLQVTCQVGRRRYVRLAWGDDADELARRGLMLALEAGWPRVTRPLCCSTSTGC